MREHRNRRKFRLGAMLTALLLAVGGVLAGGLVSSAGAVALPSVGGVYQLAVKKSGKCVDVPGASAANGALLQQWGCTEGAAWQQFTLAADGSGKYRLVNRSSGKCVDVPDYSKVSGVQLQQWGCAGQTNQQWTLAASGTDTFQVVNVNSGLCMSLKDASTASGAAVIQETCTANSNKQWAFRSVSGRTWSDKADGFASTGGGTTGGAAGSTVTVTNYADLVKYATATEPYVIKVAAAVTVTPYGHEIPVKSNKTIIGVGTSGQIVGGGFFLGTGVHNVIIRNLTIRDTRMTEDDPDDKDYDYDGIQMDTADHIWIDHNRIERMNDGLIDSRKDTSYLTVSWNVLGEQNKAFGIGWTDNVTARMTIHHNWIHDTNQRNPSIDNVAFAHLYNNYMQNVTSYGNLSRGASKTVIENSYYQSVANPYYVDTTAASLTQTGSICVSCTGKQQTNGTTFKPGDHYSYTLDPAADVPALLKQYAGPQGNIGS
ncbi:RICIN domain-containing protein [Streptomyces sp. NBC_01201]|uniref:RICIN domain-containing protein n=6 Tax=Streptomyces TaxID=1883 RepID=A0ABY9J9Y0_9ACTN|nr:MULTISPECIES: RICIN domain-containing protein [unclassified Streptomyces]WLQ64502.1 RICIN domain-containing protein [Streptomyces sp. Alt3]WSQ77886.1 RICIN domain-containing protein [Streptomyces sp. NBC_01213]WSR08653.1 RICIN domain-containing protein [Streptomyces sp. NBC_01208]WSR48599.1 RICIN domain-containing protein [Streptomyces sp. NBC_01201]